MSILAIDQSTSSTSAFIVDRSGVGRITKMTRHKQFYPASGQVEHDPEELIKNIQDCIDDCDDISAIGIDNQGESCLAWNADSKQAITPVIVWQDNRTSTEVEQLKQNGAEKTTLERAGLPLDSYFSATKLAWIIKNVPEAQQLLKRGKLRLGTTDAFFLDRLTGYFVTDISTASRTSLMNIKTGHWDEQLCQLFGVPIEALPEIVPTVGEFGWIKSRGRNIPVTASIVDQQAALYGHDCKNPGDTKITFGTGAFALMVTGENVYQAAGQGLIPTAAWGLTKGKTIYALDGGVYSAGAAINWAKALGLFTSYNQIQQFDEISAIEKNLAFVPALSGLGCPHWDRTAGGLWIGLSLDSKPTDLMQSILEGIVFRAAEVINAMDEMIPIKNIISIDGGVSENPYFCQFLADVLGRDIMVKKSADMTALGVTKLAAKALPEQIFRDIPGKKYSPETDRRPYLEKFSDAVNRSKQWRD